jgi:Glycosyltransferases involved in cell wall biogenesis
MVNCFFLLENIETAKNAALFRSNALVNKVFILANEIPEHQPEGINFLQVDSVYSSETMRKIAAESDAEFSLLYIKTGLPELGKFALERFLQIAENTSAGMLYSDFYELKNGKRENHPVINYQEGSLRDDFDFGKLLFFNAKKLKQAVSEMSDNYRFAGLYDLRLRISQQAEIFHINEFLYSEIISNSLTDNEKQFSYVDPKNREAQIEMEIACTEHLKKIGAYISQNHKPLDFNSETFPIEASVIIPVRNRENTIGAAIKSVLTQNPNFAFNLIVIDNYSTDGTTQIIEDFAKTDSRVIHIIPENKDLGIGGCWNEGIMHKNCGRFAVQLDSDDVYSDNNTLQKIVDKFHAEHCAMVIGSYTITDFDLTPIPPYLIDHCEWTDENGHNNALRINGLGAPRAFFTPVLRQIKLPNTSYGEDYAVGLAISREYKIGRIYESLYCCRRWDGNSDAALDIEKTNKNNLYKDSIRTIELKARKR